MAGFDLPGGGHRGIFLSGSGHGSSVSAGGFKLDRDLVPANRRAVGL